MIVDPVFVDRSGRRRRLIMAAGIAGTLVLLAAAVALLAGFTDVGPAAVPGWPGAETGHGAPRPHAAGAGAGNTTPPTPAATATRPARPAVTNSRPVPPPSSASASASPSASTSGRPKGRGNSPSVRPSRKN